MKLAALLIATAQLALVVSTPIPISTSDERDITVVGENFERAPIVDSTATDELEKRAPFIFSAACGSNIACTTAAAAELGFQGNPIRVNAFTNAMFGLFQIGRAACAAVCSEQITGTIYKDGQSVQVTQTEQAWISDIILGTQP